MFCKKGRPALPKLKIGGTTVMSIDPKRIAIDYYFGDLQYWKLPAVAMSALEEGYDGPALRRLAGLAAQSAKDLRAEDVEAGEIDSAFREMGVAAPITEREAQMTLARECAANAIDGKESVFDAATRVRIHLCRLSEPPELLRRIVQLSKDARRAPRVEWTRIELELKDAFSEYLLRSEAVQRLSALGGSDPQAEGAPRRREEE
jgi:hypothetical protein